MAEHVITPKELTDIIRTFAESDLQELRMSVGDVELLVSRNDVVDPGPVSRSNGTTSRPPTPSLPVPSAPAEVAAVDGGSSPPGPAPAGRPPREVAAGRDPEIPPPGVATVLSPAVGVFYRRPSPDEQPYVEVGARVEVGDPVGTMEVMKMFTTVRAETAGTVTEVLVADATMVEYHQVLMYLEPDS
jgi:acetyl-CoA carboxylase biotin carboxyl carrier protein